jgi:hypothetical protein
MPTIGEALNRRSDLQKRIAQLQERLSASVLVQEGDDPPEKPQELLVEIDESCAELERVIAQINLTNASTRLRSGMTVTEALARRDVLAMRAGAVRSAIRAATERGLFGRYSRSEIRMVRQVQVNELQRLVDMMAQSRRVLDDELQVHNWTTPLLE